MSNHLIARPARMIAGALAILALALSAAPAGASIIPIDARPNGLTYEQWSAEWWRQVLGTPAARNPLIDNADDPCALGARGMVFLMGTFGQPIVPRSCSIPAGRFLLVPLANGECSVAEGNGTTEDQLRACAADQLTGGGPLSSTVTELHATIDGTAVTVDLFGFRAASPLFAFTLPPDNILGLDPTTSPSVADGFWLILAPLSRGVHHISFGGTFSFANGGTFEPGGDYTIRVG